jgi:hypothetical protein
MDILSKNIRNQFYKNKKHKFIQAIFEITLCYKKIIKKYKKRVMEHVPRPECINIEKLTQARSFQGFPFVCQELSQ